MRSVLAVLLAVGSAVAAPVPKELKKEDDRTRLRGSWSTETANVSGQPWRDFSLHTLIFDGDNVLRAKYRTGLADATWTLKLDPEANPKRMSWVSADGKNDGYECAYAFVGEQLVVSIAHQKQNPPGSVQPGPVVTVYHFNRATK
jgi:uncharacterized protein (TIGR03067 family)